MSDLLARSGEQRLLRETAARVFAALALAPAGLADAGLLMLPFAQRDGGLHADDSVAQGDLAIAFAAKGERHATDTTLLQAVFGGGLVAASEIAGRSPLLGAIMAGEQRIAVGLHEPRARTDFHHCTIRAAPTADGWQINGLKTLAIGAEAATHLLIVARTGDGAPNSRDGLALFMVDPGAQGVGLHHYQLRDGTPVSDIRLENVTVGNAALVLGPDRAAAELDRAVALVRLCLAAEASGIMRSLVTNTAAYVAERQQFGQAIGAFQVVQHRLADMAINADQATALVAAVALDTTNAAAITAAHRAIADMGMAVAKAAIQLHGGYGMTEDLPCGRALRRMMTIALLF